MAQSGEVSAVQIRSSERLEVIETYQKLRARSQARGPDGKAESLPNNLYSFLLRLLADLRAGQSVTLLQSRHEFTTIEASKVLECRGNFWFDCWRRRTPFPQGGHTPSNLRTRCAGV